MKAAIYILCLLSIFSCSTAPKTAEDILNRSIKAHDPEGKWHGFKQAITIKSQSVFSDNQPENLILTLDIAHDYLCYQNDRRKVACCFQNDKTMDMLKNQDCGSYSWTKDFYTYTLGLPMKLQDHNTNLQATFTDTLFNNKECFTLYVNYEKENWEYYINKSNYYLEGFKFVQNNDNTKGEIVVNNGTTTINGVNFSSTKTWYALDGKLIGTDSLSATE